MANLNMERSSRDTQACIAQLWIEARFAACDLPSINIDALVTPDFNQISFCQTPLISPVVFDVRHSTRAAVWHHGTAEPFMH